MIRLDKLRLPTVLSDLLRTHETPVDQPDWTERRRKLLPAAQERQPYQRRSLYAEILDFMFAPMALLWPLSVVLTFVVARSLADVPFNRELEERLRALTNQVEITGSLAAPKRRELPLGLPASPDEGKTAYQILSAAGDVLAGDALLPRPQPDEFPDPDQIGRRTVSHRSADWRIAYALVTQAGSNGAKAAGPMLVQVAETLDRRNDLANVIIRGIIVPQFLLLPVAVFLVWFGLSRGLHPLKAVQERIRNRRPDDFSPIDPHGTPEEIAPLVTAFNDLLMRLDENIGAQKRFIGDAAHQLKTPLAGLRTQAELALKEGDPEGLRSSLRYIASSAERSARMVSQLLSLARMENLRDAALFEKIDLVALVPEVVGDWVPQALRRGIDLGVECNVAAAPIQGLPLLLRELMNNLIDNALQHTPREGSVTVRLSRARPKEADEATGASAHPAGLVLEVEDTGKGISLAEQGRIFDRFYQVLGGRSEGSGLGLAIVMEIAEQHQASVSVHSPVTQDPETGRGAGTCFRVLFADLSASPAA
ncbi:MAG TPA: ATP-binding protein [Lautropia sp.]|nr:ATP-binding protein [Lautropia sp.]